MSASPLDLAAIGVEECVCVCVCVCAHTCVRVCVRAHVCTRVCGCVRACMWYSHFICSASRPCYLKTITYMQLEFPSPPSNVTAPADSYGMPMQLGRKKWHVHACRHCCFLNIKIYRHTHMHAHTLYLLHTAIIDTFLISKLNL